MLSYEERKAKLEMMNIYIPSNEQNILESGASLNRIMSTLSKKNLDFGIITSFRKSDEISLDKKQEKNDQLLKYIRSMLGDQKAYGTYRMIGHWKECSVPLQDGDTIKQCVLRGGVIQDTVEESWLIINDKYNPDFFDALRKSAREYNQDAFIARINGKFGLFGKDGSIWDEWPDFNKNTITVAWERLLNKQGYSELKNKRVHGKIHHFIFEGIMTPNPTNSSYMLFEAKNILWRETGSNNFQQILDILVE